MFKHLCLTVLWLIFFSPVSNAELPSPVITALQTIGLPAENVSVYVQALAAEPAELPPPVIAHQATLALNPASTMKLLTTYAGLTLLGSHYRWKTEVYTDGMLARGVLTGNLYIKGYGDPSFMSADVWRLLSSLRQLGISEIQGDLVVDNSYFASQNNVLVPFDGDVLRAYNATPSALAINLKASSFRFDADKSAVHVVVEPDLRAINIKNQLTVVKGDCNLWRNQLRYAVKPLDDGAEVTFSGEYPADCQGKYLDLLVLDESVYTLQLFKKLWAEVGGRFQGKLRYATVPTNAVKRLRQDSRPLAQIVPDINKWSNNLMARQLLLTIAGEKTGMPATEANGAQQVMQWLDTVGLHFNELIIENGSGLSRLERISAEHMAALLVHAFYSPVMPELMSALPILGLDGTMQKRMLGSTMQGRAHLKTGTLQDVYTLAGYVLGKHGQRYVVVLMVNDAKAAQTKLVQDALLAWVHLRE